MTDFARPSRILITCAKAMPPTLAGEIKALGFPVTALLEAGVETRGSLADTMTLNLHLRTAHRVLFLVGEFSAVTADQLYTHASAFPWEDLIPAGGYLCVNGAIHTDSITDTRYAVLKCKDAVVDRIRTATGKRPDSGSDPLHTVVFLYWHDRDAKIYLDTSGEPLSRRGYRRIPLQAPMQETLAAGVILATGWKGQGHFINPMCGSGTLAIEAALIGQNRAPGLLRSNFGFQHIAGFDAAAWTSLRKQLNARPKRALSGRIVATDIDARAVDAARKNAATAGVEKYIDFSVCDFGDTPVPAATGDSVVVVNPEYGERMGSEADLTPLYFGIGDFFKQKCAGYRGYVFTGNLALAKCVGLRSKRRIPFFNSRIECRLLEYELYKGRKDVDASEAPDSP